MTKKKRQMRNNKSSKLLEKIIEFGLAAILGGLGVSININVFVC